MFKKVVSKTMKKFKKVVSRSSRTLWESTLIFRPHLYPACAMFRIKRVSTCIYGMTYDRYIYIYENSTVRLASVGLAQARPNLRKSC